MVRNLLLVLVLCGCVCADPGYFRIDYSNMHPVCESYFRQYAVYLDKLEATGKFSPYQMACLRFDFAEIVRGYHNRTPDQEEGSKASCRAGLKVLPGIMEKVKDIPNLSQEEFDADWGGMGCG